MCFESCFTSRHFYYQSETFETQNQPEEERRKKDLEEFHSEATAPAAGTGTDAIIVI